MLRARGVGSRFWSRLCLCFALPPSAAVVVCKIRIYPWQRKGGGRVVLPFLFSECRLLRAACVRISSPRGTAAIMCLAPLNVRSTMSVLQDRQLQDGGETGFVFSLMEISHLFLLHHHVGLRSGLVNNPIPFAGVFIFSARRKQDARFPPAREKEREGRCTKLRQGSSVSCCRASLQQTGSPSSPP